MFYRQIFRYILISLFFIPPILEGEVRFTDVTYSAGIEFFHIDGRSGNKYFMETLGAGVAFLIITTTVIPICILSMAPLCLVI
ncbi:hypothetical protein CMK13_14045 [Candidatus Poribacteria bacterium]|nr:hypothetical protein [Candidatus Poribacteria bacterium]OUT58070.1 MAG: hypothetical protein CBB75_13505 [bacterium TMED15]